MTTFWNLFILTSGVLAIGFAIYRRRWVLSQPYSGSDLDPETASDLARRMKDIARGAKTFLVAEYKRLIPITVILAVILAVLNLGVPGSHWSIGLSVLVGAALSSLSGWVGMTTATGANARTAYQAIRKLNPALSVAFLAGTVLALTVTASVILGIWALYQFCSHFWPEAEMLPRVISVISGYSLGASTVALFARVGGGIFTKAADVGADLAGKVDEDLPEDCGVNAGVTADNVGDNVGDVAGMAADILESFAGAIIATMITGAAALTAVEYSAEIAELRESLVLLPLVLAALGIVVSIASSFLVRVKEGGNPQHALNWGTFTAVGAMIILSIPIIHGMFGSLVYLHDGESFGAWGMWGASSIGAVSGIIIGLTSEFFCSAEFFGINKKWLPVHKIAKASDGGPANNIIAGIGAGMKSVPFVMIFLAATILAAYYFAGPYGLPLAAVGMLATTPIQLAVDAFGPIADNAGGLAESCMLPPETRARTDKLDAVGNTTAAIGKGFAIGSAGLTAMGMFGAYTLIMQDLDLSISNTNTVIGVIIGGLLPFAFAALTIEAVGIAAHAIKDEVLRQIREIPKVQAAAALLKNLKGEAPNAEQVKIIREGELATDPDKCIEIATVTSFKKMTLPCLIGIVTSTLVGFADPNALGGLMLGVTVSGLCLAIFMSNAGGAWDNAKKLIEEDDEAYGGKNSVAHKAAVVGDTIGDPFKDTSGPGLNIFVKVVCVVPVVIAYVLRKWHFGF
jgi:K(+)-stimulated pyrophosphate-energized sodium pump